MAALKRLFSRESLLALLVMAVGFLGAFGLPQAFGVTTDQLVLALFAVTGLELLSQRVITLTEIRDQVLRLEATIAPTVSADAIFLRRTDGPGLAEIIDRADEVWFAGKSLNNLMASEGSHLVSSSVRLRFLAHDPTTGHLAESLASQSFSNRSAERIAAGMRQGFEQLTSFMGARPEGVSVRLSKALIPNGFTIVNPEKPDAWMRIELFSYRVSLAERRSIVLRRATEPIAFAFYFSQFVKLWEDGVPVRGAASVGTSNAPESAKA